MVQISTYLSFNGNCREAMTFYQECFGGKLRFQAIGEAPLSEKMPKKMKDLILLATLNNKKFVLLGSDILGEKGLLVGNNIAICLNFNTEKEIRNCYDKLSVGGVFDPSEKNETNGNLFGELTDKYGNHWLLYYNKK
jgi:PhnB protein